MIKKPKTYKRLRKNPNVNFEQDKAVSRLYLFMGPVYQQHCNVNQTRQWADVTSSLVLRTNVVTWTGQGSEQTLSHQWYSVPMLWCEPDTAVSRHYPLTGTVYQRCNVNRTWQWADISPHWLGIVYRCCDVNQTRQWADIISSLVQCTAVMRWTRQGITSSLVQCAHVNIKWKHQWAHVMSSPVQCATNDYSAVNRWEEHGNWPFWGKLH